MTIELLPFGKTGHRSTRILFGAAALAAMRQERADRILEQLFADGVNHIDAAASHGDAELHLGPWMQRYRDEFFLATKTGDRDFEGAAASIRRSLDRMKTDRIDLIQLHNLVEPDEWEQALSPGGALEAAIAAREEGLVRFIGVTGHGTRIAAMHLRSLERFPFDSVLLPYNYTMMQNRQYADDFDALLAVCRDRGVAVQTIKSAARGRWRDSNDRRFSWYEPIREPEALRRSVRWVLARPGIFLNTSSDATLLEEILAAAAEGGDRPSEREMKTDVERLAIEPLFTADQERI